MPSRATLHYRDQQSSGAVRPRQGAGADGRHCPGAQEDLALGRLDQSMDAADQRGLAGARGADEGQDLAVGHVEIDTLQGEITGSVALLEVLETQHGSFRSALARARDAGPALSAGPAWC